MIAEKMKPFVQNNSAIRMMFEEGNRLRAKYGADKVYDFSLGNPSVPAPDCVREAIIDLVNNEEPTVLHGYMSNAGFEDVRETIAQSPPRRIGTAFSAHNLIMTVGAASGLNVILKTILNPGEEVIVFAPYFLEYGAYVRNYDGKLVEISPNTETFQPNLKELEEFYMLEKETEKSDARKVAVLMKGYLQSMKSNIREIIRYIDDTTLEKSNEEKKDEQEAESTMSEKVQEFVNLTITEHMGKAYSEWKLNQDKEAVSEIDKKYQKLLETLSPEQEEVITEYCNAIFSSGAETEEFFYRLGLKDGLNLKNTVKSVLEMIS